MNVANIRSTCYASCMVLAAGELVRSSRCAGYGAATPALRRLATPGYVEEAGDVSNSVLVPMPWCLARLSGFYLRPVSFVVAWVERLALGCHGPGDVQ